MRKALILVVLLMMSSAGCSQFLGGDTTQTPEPRVSGTVQNTPTPQQTQTATATTEPTSEAVEVDASAVEDALVTQLNSQREEEGMRPLISADKVHQSARFHAENMAEQQYPSASAGGYSTIERHERFDIDRRCRVANNANGGVLDGREVEVVGVFNADNLESTENIEQQVAENLLSNWRTEGYEPLFLEDAETVGVGVVVNDSRVFANVVMCG